MPFYSFSNPSNEKEIVEIFQHMNDEHVYVQDGITWDRVWHNPQIGIDTKIDPNSVRQWMDKTSKPGTYGDLLDRSAELSEMRAKQHDGVDPVKKKADEQYSKERGGRKPVTNLNDLAINIG